jgi:hypothetical protein
VLLPRRQQLNERQRRADVGPSESDWRPPAVRTIRSTVGAAPCVPGRDGASQQKPTWNQCSGPADGRRKRILNSAL